MLYNYYMLPTRVIKSPRAARAGQLRLGCSGVLFNDEGTQVLLTRRKDNGMWCLPGGRVDPGEWVSESIAREFLEETGLSVKVKHLIGVYSDPDQLIVYPDGNKVHTIVLVFLLEKISGIPIITDETSDIRYINTYNALQMDLFHNHAEQLVDALKFNTFAMIK